MLKVAEFPVFAAINLFLNIECIRIHKTAIVITNLFVLIRLRRQTRLGMASLKR